MSLLIVLGIAATGLLLLTAVIEDMATRTRPSGCDEGCRCRGTGRL